MPDLIIAQHWEQEEIDEFVADILTVAVESGYYGIGYWASCSTERNEEGFICALHNISDVETEEELCEYLSGHRIWVVLSGIVNRQYDSKVAKTYLDWIKDGVANKDTCNIDAEAADVIVQLAIFGEIVYG